VPEFVQGAHDTSSPKERALRDGHANRSGNFQIDDELELRRLLHRQVPGLRAIEYLHHDLCQGIVLPRGCTVECRDVIQLNYNRPVFPD
jgi:hypothetical protein